MKDYLILAVITIFSIFLSTFFGYILPMMQKEYKFKEYWKKCPQCDKTKKKNEVYNIINFWKYGGYCKKHSPKTYKNILFTILFTLLSVSAFIVEYFKTGDFFTINSVSMYIVNIMLTYATVSDIRGLVLPDISHIVIFAVGLFNMFYNAITTGDKSIYTSHLFGMACLSLIFFALSLLGKGGFGDVKMLAALGMLLGLKNSILAFAFACIVGLAFIIVRVIYGKITDEKESIWKKRIPFGPYLAAGTLIMTNFGHLILEAYLKFF